VIDTDSVGDGAQPEYAIGNREDRNSAHFFRRISIVSEADENEPSSSAAHNFSFVAAMSAPHLQTARQDTQQRNSMPYARCRKKSLPSPGATAIAVICLYVLMSLAIALIAQHLDIGSVSNGLRALL